MSDNPIIFTAVDQSVFDAAQVDTPADRPCIIITATGLSDSRHNRVPLTVRQRLSLAEAVKLHAQLGAIIAEMFESSRNSLLQRERECQRGTISRTLLTRQIADSHRSRTAPREHQASGQVLPKEGRNQVPARRSARSQAATHP